MPFPHRLAVASTCALAVSAGAVPTATAAPAALTAAEEAAERAVPLVTAHDRAVGRQVRLERRHARLQGRRAAQRGLARELRDAVPALAQLNKATIPLLEQVRPASSCQNEVILPWSVDKIEDPDFPAIGPVFQEQPKPLIGLSGESRTFDANGQYFRVSLNAAQYAASTGNGNFLLTDRPPVGANPPKPAQRSPLRPDVPCETQEPPDLRTEQGAPPQSFKVRELPASLDAKSREIATTWLQRQLVKTGRADEVKVSDKPIAPSEIPLIGKGAK